MKTMVQQFEENRKEVADFVIDSKLSNTAKNKLGLLVNALVASAFASGYAFGKEDYATMDLESWTKAVYEKDSPLVHILEDIAFDFRGLGGVK
jgi:hypothetical protein